MSEIAFIHFENGEIIEVTSFGYTPNKPVLTELVFNTSMTGYQEILTDPSYCDQTVIMTYPLIGNYGINTEDMESITPAIKGLVVSEYQDNPSNFRSRGPLETLLKNNQILGLANIDTRMLTKKIRTAGTQKVVISKERLEKIVSDDFLQKPLPTDQVSRVTTKAISHFPSRGGKRVVMLDFGYKKNILESLLTRGCDVIVVPYDTSFEKIQQFNPQGIMLSNGPGDPKSLLQIIPTIQKLQDQYPMFSICMGHQVFALANGADTEKMKFGHRGANHPVIDTKTKRIYITSQNHGYCVMDSTIDNTELEITELNLNDKSIEGLRHKTKPSFSVQYHPEANPGPNDTKFLFDHFVKSMTEEEQGAKNA